MLTKKKLLISIFLISISSTIKTQGNNEEMQFDDEDVTRSHKIRFKKDVICEKDLTVKHKAKIHKLKVKEDSKFEDDLEVEGNLTVDGTLFTNNASIGTLDVGSISIGSLIITNSLSVCDIIRTCSRWIKKINNT